MTRLSFAQARGPTQTNLIDKISNQSLIWLFEVYICITLYFSVFINIFRQSTMTVYNNLQKFTKLAAIFMICDLKSEESTMRFEIMSNPLTCSSSIKIGKNTLSF